MNNNQIFLIVVVSIVAWMIVTVAGNLRRHSGNDGKNGKVCRACSTGNPTVAKFCRRCGRPV